MLNTVRWEFRSGDSSPDTKCTGLLSCRRCLARVLPWTCVLQRYLTYRDTCNYHREYVWLSSLYSPVRIAVLVVPTWHTGQLKFKAFTKSVLANNLSGMVVELNGLNNCYTAFRWMYSRGVT
ncbi:hypothetical protein TNCT_434931 [Trichonephila clavata]|uniref:Uncharacterized protein n=1 Tax=Trichonephila clavata TaxID=2740835 RepID=A0A8X6KYW3_TRICU|nr:hypothetical protein TNCT_434931 [Trichonephila clavata]